MAVERTFNLAMKEMQVDGADANPYLIHGWIR